MPTASDLETLLSQDRWIRRIALQLAGDGNVADDLVQEAWLLARGRSEVSRGWLRGVLSNLWRQSKRSEARRQRREQEAACGESQPSTLELVEELALRREVSAALLALDEPYRRAIYLRFHRELELKSIAKETGVALSTVHERIQIGLQRMRAQLDHGASRRSWCLGLLALGKPGLPLKPAIGVMGMGIGIKVAAVAVVAIGVVALSTERSPAPTLEAGLDASAAEPEPGALSDSKPIVEPAPPERTQLVQEADSQTPERGAPMRRGRVVDLHGNALAQVLLGTHSDSEVSSNERGHFQLAIDSTCKENTPILSRDERYFTLIPGLPNASGESLVVLAPEVSLAGQVSDLDGAPIEAAELSIQIHQSLFHEQGIDRPWVTPDRAKVQRSDAQGSFEFPRAAGGPGVYLHVSATGFLPERVALSEFGDRNMRIELEPGSGVLLGGLVLAANGLPLPDASVSAGDAIVKSDAEGRFKLLWDPDATGNSERDDKGVWVPEPIPHFITALKRGHGFARLDLSSLDPSQSLRIQISDAGHSIKGRVLDSFGKGRANVRVWSPELTHFGFNSYSQGNSLSRYSIDVENRVSESGQQGTLTDADGHFTLEHCFAREYKLFAIDTESLERGLPVQRGVDLPEFVIELQSVPTTLVAGRLISMGGVPLHGVEVTAQSRPPGNLMDTGGGSTKKQISDAEGRFAFERLAPEGVVLQLYRPDFLWKYRGLSEEMKLDELEFTVALDCEVLIDLTHDPELADEFSFLDAGGEAIEVKQSHGAFISLLTRSELSKARSNVLKLGEDAVTLVLFKADQEVRRLGVSLDPTQRTTIKP